MSAANKLSWTSLSTSSLTCSCDLLLETHKPTYEGKYVWFSNWDQSCLKNLFRISCRPATDCRHTPPKLQSPSALCHNYNTAPFYNITHIAHVWNWNNQKADHFKLWLHDLVQNWVKTELYCPLFCHICTQQLVVYTYTVQQSSITFCVVN